MKDAKIPFTITCTARSIREQIALYAQGREELDDVNKLRMLAGIRPINEEENSRAVTWTMLSKHIIDLYDSNPLNDKSDAFDIVILDKNGKGTYDMKADINADHISDYINAGNVGKSVGLRWGGDFKYKNGKPKPDYVHFEI
jgi:peptidoglycan L-alanyl-D-glutamate endopeptidase CwlK